MRRFCRRLVLASSAVVLIGGPAWAQSDFPTRPITLIVPLQAATASDLVARVIAQNFSARTGKSMVVENVAGGGGGIGAHRVARAPADGYTVGAFNNGVHTILPAMGTKLGFDPFEDFAPVTLLARFPSVLIVNPDLPVKSLAEFIALAKKQPGKINFGSSGNGSTNHLAGELLKDLAKIDIVHVPYRGAAPAMNDLIAGHIPMMFDNMPAMKPQVAAGTVRALAVASATRSKLFPELPTMIEAGVPGFEATAWFGLVAPAATPADVTKTIIAGVEKALQNPDMAKKLADLGAEPGNVSGDAFGDFLKAETAKWGKVVKDSGARVD